jgi:hypothetical protein
MKKSKVLHASQNLLGTLLILSFLISMVGASMDELIGLTIIGKHQWQEFSDGLSMVQPHRVHFPN